MNTAFLGIKLPALSQNGPTKLVLWNFWWSAYSSSTSFFLMQYWCKLGSSISSSIVRSSCEICCFLLVSVFKVKAMFRFGIGLGPKLKKWFRSLTILPTKELCNNLAPWESTSLTWSLGSFIVQMHQVVIAFIFHLFSVPLTRSQISQVHIVQNMKIHSGTKKLLYLLHFHLDTPTGSWEIFVLCKIWVSGIKYNMKRNACHLKSDNLQYNTLIDQASDGPSIILIDWK